MQRQKWQDWYDSLPATTKEYLKTQPLWHDIDMFKAFAVGAVVGVIIGLCF
jgi:hypothetical protein